MIAHRVWSPVEARVMVHAVMAAPEAPSPSDLAGAIVLAQNTIYRFPREPWGYAALCDVAARIGDVIMLHRYVEELERVAPEHAETARARAALKARAPSPWLTAVWGLVAAVILATFAESIRRAAVALRRGRVAAVFAVAVAGMLFAAAPARAEPSKDHPERVSEWTIDDANPEASVPTAQQRDRSPLEFGYWLQDLIAKAQAASKRGDHEAAIRYFTAMAKAVPERAISFTRLCEEYAAIGDRDKAIAACANGLYAGGVQVDDYRRYMELVITKPGKLSKDDVASLSKVVQHLVDDPGTADLGRMWECEIAVRTSDSVMLKECTTALAGTAPHSAQAIMYQWALAAQNGDYKAARQVLDDGQASLAPPTLERLRKQTDAGLREARTRHVLLGISIALGIVAIGALVWLWRMSAAARRGGAASPPVAGAGVPMTAAAGGGGES
jgi:hypothetical protein